MTQNPIAAVLAADLTDLLGDLGVNPFDLPSSAAALRRDLKLAVRSALGFSLTVRTHLQLPVTLHVVDGPLSLVEVLSSLRVPLGPAESDAGTTVTFYADRPGALADLAVDLTEALGLPSEVAGLDDPLPSEVIYSGLVGLEEFTSGSRAVGILIAQGLTVAEARATLLSHVDEHDRAPTVRELLTKAPGPTPRPNRPALPPEHLATEDQQ